MPSWLQGKTVVAVTSGANIPFDRLRVVAELAELGAGREALLASTITGRPGSLREVRPRTLKRAARVMHAFRMGARVMDVPVIRIRIRSKKMFTGPSTNLVIKVHLFVLMEDAVYTQFVETVVRDDAKLGITELRHRCAPPSTSSRCF